MAVLASLVGFCHLIDGFTNRDLVERTAALLDRPYTNRQATYDLRQLRRKGLIAKIPKSLRYQLTAPGRRVAVLFTKTYGRQLAPGLTVLDLRLPETVSAKHQLATAWRRFERALDDFLDQSLQAA